MSSTINNLRITFWGTQGSLQHFPGPDEVDDYTNQIAVDMIYRVLNDLQARNTEGPINLEELIGGPINDETIRQCFERIGRARPAVYGGETTCTEIETSDGYLIVIDGGSGIRHFARQRIMDWQDRTDRTLYILGTHDHLDHRIGLPFSDVCFARPAFQLNVFGNYRFLAALDDRFAVFSKQVTEATHRDDPLDYRMMAAEFHGTQIRDLQNPDPKEREVPNCGTHDLNEPIVLGKTVITPFPVYHAETPCLAYRFEHEDSVFLFCTDHELRHGDDPQNPRQKQSEEAEERVRRMAQNADVAYFDGQYLLEEYHGRKGTGRCTPGVSRMDWGHSCIEDVVERAYDCQIKRTYIGHHDPDREWLDRLTLDERLQADSKDTGCHIELAKDRQVVDL